MLSTKRISYIEFLNRANKVHGNKYSYDISSYAGTKYPIKIHCSTHGEFMQRAENHLRGQGCKKCSQKFNYTEDDFINMSIEVHGMKYDYTETKYINNRIKINIKCKLHGVFHQSPRSHLKGGEGCNKCKYSITDINDFMIKANRIHEDKYGYDKAVFLSVSEKIEIKCKKHGYFFQKAWSHLNGNGCAICAGKKINIDEFIYKSTNMHGDKYDYSIVELRGARKKIDIICKEHGIFKQYFTDHLRGSGCNKCVKRKGLIQYNYSKLGDIKGILYICKLYNDNETFFKVGVTTRSIPIRMSKIPYKYEIIHSIEGNIRYIVELESKILETNKNTKYMPLINFGGKTECFKTIIK